MVLESRAGTAAGSVLDAYLANAEVATEPITLEQLAVARDAWRRYGKGNHPAALIFGDCFAYALANTTGESLLFKGNDFAQTDIEAAW